MRPGVIFAIFSAIVALGASSPIDPNAVVEVRNLDGTIATDFEVRTVVIDESVNPATVLKRQGGATSCRKIQNWFKWKLADDSTLRQFLNDRDKNIDSTIGYTRMDKNFCFDGTVVSDSTGGDVKDANVVGDITSSAKFAGFTYDGVVSGTVFNQYENYQGNGRGAHTSKQNIRITWKCPAAACPVAQVPIFQKELYIRAFADGRAECRGGNFCREDGLLPPGWNDL
ncbi:hypothetical protein LTR70_008779 [Exophiala xenobiotica]|uniref:Uncharacterized protein n=1 Tax=Lithohypha guttulata TaxID=1690604 RepID=A0ABR0JW88_9EURO|nr:hypothetical protein LTR24_009819 [Lithohypha guttulata]KAK5311449.1 hypothetical protein LTR70_008779 [Exophiala xenobiotica]